MRINLLRHRLNLITQRIRNLRRTNLAAMTVILRLVIEELILSDDLDHRERNILSTIKIHRTCKLAAHNGALCHHSLALGKRSLHSRVKILGLLHLGNTEAAAAVSRFHEHRKSEPLNSLLCKTMSNLALADKNIIGTLHEVNILQVALARELVKCDRRNESVASAVRHPYHLEVSLHETVLSGSSVLHDVGIVELDLLTAKFYRKICLVDQRTLILRNNYPFLTAFAVRCERPLAETCKHLIHIISCSIDLRCGKLTAAHRHLPFRGVAAVYNHY